ncbi:MAG: UDP-glucose 4-epimerase [Sphingopyxis sp.]|jgi:nucleoside-diphosphate-sugar epimerase|nr:UDP-glucose 4-epimerase [Sphingopyxis sp.]
MYVIVTGSAGKLGRAAVGALRGVGHRVVGLDLCAAADPARSIRCDCTDFGEVMSALSGLDITGGVPDAVVHLAGIPMPGLATDQKTFAVNTISTYNVFSACARLGIKHIVWASSETILGLPFTAPPAFVPIDETHPDTPNWSYALAKQLGETAADAFCRWDSEMTILSLRFSNVFANDDYAQLAAFQAKPAWRRMNLWSYVDVEDAGEACRLAVEADLKGHHRMIVAAEDSLMDIATAYLLRDFFPEVPVRTPVDGCQSLLSSAAAGRLIGYRPRISWRDRVGEGAA